MDDVLDSRLYRKGTDLDRYNVDGGNSTIVRIWWTTFIGVIQPSRRRPEKPKSVLFDETSTDFIPGTSEGFGGAALALGAHRVAFCT